MNILIVLTSHDTLGDTGLKTGFWLEELAAPYYVFKDAGADITLASPLGGEPPLDPKSNEPDFQTDDTRRFEKDADAIAALKTTIKLSEVSHIDFDAVFYPGGHGPLWDLTEDSDSVSLIQNILKGGKPVSLVCHAPGVLRDVKDEQGLPYVKGKKVTGFTNSEEEAVNLTHVVPYLVEDMLKENGASFSAGKDWEAHVMQDGPLITGQNPGSSAEAAKLMLSTLSQST